METNRSVWREAVEIPARGRLEGNLSADVAVIGAGMAGVLTAHALSKRGVGAVILEAERIAGGQTQNTTAKITSQHGMVYDAWIRTFGEKKAGQYVRANEMAIREYASCIREMDIACDFEQVPAHLYSNAVKEPLLAEAEAARKLGIDARFVSETELPFPVAGAVRFEGQARFHPLKFLRDIARKLEIYENTPVLSAEGHRLRTPHGTVNAGHIVFATHFPFVNIPGWYFLRMHQERSYVLALKSNWLPRGVYLGVDADGLSFREADGLLLLGGGNHRTGENSNGGQYERLRRRAMEIVPGCTEVACWSAQDCMTLDGVPYIGRFSDSTPNWYVATGFGKWGMTSSMVSALLISGQICGETPDWAEVFSPSRFQPSASLKNLATDTVQAFKGLAREYLTVPRSTLDALPIGHGGIVEAAGRKAGVYKDETGLCHIVNPRCPHLGCQLEWNPDERSWDCPCHGSRFRFDGTRIDNPASDDLSGIDEIRQ